MIQDTYYSLVVPRIQKRFRSLFVIGTEMGKAIIKEDGKAFTNPSESFTLTYRCEKGEVWVKELADLRGKKAKAFPFLFINLDTVSQSDAVGNFRIGEVVLATLGAKNPNGSPADYSTQRDVQSFLPYLNTLAEMFEEATRQYFGCEHTFWEDKQSVYCGSMLEGKVYSDYVDAIVYKNLKLRNL